MLLALGMKKVNYRENGQSFDISFPLKKEELLDLAEKMSVVEEVWLEQGREYIKEQLFYMQLEELLFDSWRKWQRRSGKRVCKRKINSTRRFYLCRQTWESISGEEV